MSGGSSKDLQGTVAVDRAVTIGLLWVNGPVFLLIVGPIVWTLAATDGSAQESVGFYLCAAGWLLA
jgi:hypothetical protein